MAKNKLVALIIVVVIVAGLIYYLESRKVRPADSDDAGLIISSDNGSGASATSNVFLPQQKYVPQKDAVKSALYPAAPELAGISGYINAQPFTLEQLRGKVVLLDFWTYSCINCIRTQPYLNAWHKAYADDGLVIVGVHTPEFEFEKDYGNVQKAVGSAGLKYPVVQDNNYATWTAYRNRWWPRKFLIDIDGYIRYDHIGEGAYDETEDKIKELLMERAETLKAQFDMGKSSELAGFVDADFLSSGPETPEIYFGYKFTRGNFGSKESFAPEQLNAYAQPEDVIPNKAYLVGRWLNKADYSELAEATGTVLLNFTATKVNIVASSDPASNLTLKLDGRRIAPNYIGETEVGEERLYNIVSLVFKETHLLEIEVSQPGFRIYTFTFG
ncbi:thioredoxin family protein [Candidatus Woesearchaeota archaeon]|nr:thioredoxin family protein [Candidatus Woesearchaeota archaeon]